jgi:hypothetical protein
MIRITIDTGNAAFSDGNKGAEVARILRELADRLDDSGAEVLPVTLRDYNGNRVGEAKGK